MNEPNTLNDLGSNAGLGYQPLETMPKSGFVLLLDDWGPQVWEAKQYHEAIRGPHRPGMPTEEARKVTHWAALPPLPNSNSTT